MGEQMGVNFGVKESVNSDKNNKEKRDRVDKLRDKDNHYEDSVYDLARTENEFRNDLSLEGISGKAVDKLADKFSDEALRRMKADKERWMDSLTGLRNKNAFKEELPQLLSMEKRTKQNCSVLMIDFDHFKEVNDSLGHLAGDNALKIMADLINNQVRDSDIVYRFGGEEFIVFLPNTTSLTAQVLAEKIRETVQNNVMEIVDEKEEKIHLNKTVSIGVVGTNQLREWDEYKEGDADKFLDKLVGLADSAVFASKAGGRNRVTAYHED
jgi:diguanylate cyclase (GGDEF)-like protein